MQSSSHSWAHCCSPSMSPGQCIGILPNKYQKAAGTKTDCATVVVRKDILLRTVKNQDVGHFRNIVGARGIIMGLTDFAKYRNAVSIRWETVSRMRDSGTQGSTHPCHLCQRSLVMSSSTVAVPPLQPPCHNAPSCPSGTVNHPANNPHRPYTSCHFNGIIRPRTMATLVSYCRDG